MKNRKVWAVYFSPTGGTRRYVCAVAQGLSDQYEEIDLTDRFMRAQEHAFSADDLMVVGVPVYYGRIPQMDGGLLKTLRGENTPAVLVVSYGNRAYEDALLEMGDCLVQQGFDTVGAGAFVAPHTFSERIGKGRPNEEDLRVAAGFAAELKARGAHGKLKLPGNRPYREFQTVPFAPKGGKNCNDCGTCARICPAGAIEKSDYKKTEKDTCIRCLACVKQCPQKARSVSGPIFKMAVKTLENNLLKHEKKASVFVAEAVKK